jgi:hypothetical protein
MSRSWKSTRRARTGMRLVCPLLTALCVVLLATPAISTDRKAAAQAGAYCPLPEKGQKPVCLSPAEAQYQDFFDAIERGEIEDHHAAAVEADLQRGASGDQAYLALSSVSYGYYRLAGLVGLQADADPGLLRRLAHWNDLLLDVYGESAADARFQQAVRAAAVDLHRRTPTAGDLCARSEHGEAECAGADVLVRALAQIDSSASIRAPLTSLMNRLVGDTTPPETVTRPASGKQ